MADVGLEVALNRLRCIYMCECVHVCGRGKEWVRVELAGSDTEPGTLSCMASSQTMLIA